MRRVLQAMRRTHTPEQRLRDIHLWKVSRPAWMLPSDPLVQIYTRSSDWLAQGELTWAVVFMANEALWEPGADDHPAGVVYSFDPWFERRPDRMVDIGQRIFRYHQSELRPRRPWERRVYDGLKTGSERPLHEELPPSLSGGRIVYHSSTVLHRAHLPHGHLTGSVLPMLVQRHQAPRVCVPMPHALWPGELLQRW